MTKKQFEEITEWQMKTFRKANALSKLAHLKSEMEELAVELILDNSKNLMERRLEFADCFILLFGAAASDGMDYSDICNAIKLKMGINKKRKWGEPQENGVVNHIKDDDDKRI